MLLTLSACGVSSGKPKLNVNIPGDCQKIVAAVKPTIKKGDDARAVAARFAAWGQENASRVKLRDKCEQRIKDAYAKGGV